MTLAAASTVGCNGSIAAGCRRPWPTAVRHVHFLQHSLDCASFLGSHYPMLHARNSNVYMAVYADCCSVHQQSSRHSSVTQTVNAVQNVDLAMYD